MADAQGSGGGPSVNDGVVVWSRFDAPLATIVGGALDEMACVRRDNDDWAHFMDEAVPPAMVDNVIGWLDLVRAAGTDWVQSEDVVEAAPRNVQLRKVVWTSASAGAKLMYAVLRDDSTAVALEVAPSAATDAAVRARGARPFGLVTGDACMHPFIHAQEFEYVNSDGSTNARSIEGEVTPASVLAKFAHDTRMHAANEEH